VLEEDFARIPALIERAEVPTTARLAPPEQAPVVERESQPVQLGLF